MTGEVATDSLRPVEGGVTAARGFRAAGVSAGLKAEGRRDVALILADEPAAAAAMFTRNAVVAAPVVVSREAVSGGVVQAVAINAGNANACTGVRGLADARDVAAHTASVLGIAPGLVAVASTGVIGVPLPLDMVCSGVTAAAGALEPSGGQLAAEAIMTTDTSAKQAAFRVAVGDEAYTVGGMAKGSGMIRPDMATMLAFITTDAPLSARACDTALRGAVATSFNRVTIDGDTSTNDMVLLMASRAAGGAIIEEADPSFGPVAHAVHRVCEELARMIARDGEGATTLVDVLVTGAADDADAALVAFTVAESPLVKTAVFGRDANWGRVAMAVGRSHARIDPARLEIRFAGILTCEEGTAVPFDEDAALAALSASEVEIAVDLHVGEASARVWTCDLTCDYVKINADYRT